MIFTPHRIIGSWTPMDSYGGEDATLVLLTDLHHHPSYDAAVGAECLCRADAAGTPPPGLVNGTSPGSRRCPAVELAGDQKRLGGETESYGERLFKSAVNKPKCLGKETTVL